MSHEAWPARTAARKLLIQLKQHAKAAGDVEKVRHLAQAQRCMEIANQLYRNGWAQ